MGQHWLCMLWDVMSIFSPYLGFVVGFYECFLALCIGTFIGGFIFDKKYLRNE
jgi:hypothetical protein